MKKLVTHNGKYHPDEIFACAVLELVLDKQSIQYEIIRTRDEDVIKSSDYVFDVGGVYDPAINRYDHHQREGAGKRADGIPYASFGLAWKHFGMDLCPSQEIFDEVDLKIVSGIDAVDNGVSIATSLYENVGIVDFGDIGSSYMPSWKNSDNEAYDAGFFEMLSMAKGFLSRKISLLIDLKEAEILVEAAYQASEDKRLVILDEYYSGKEVLSLHPEPLFVMFPNTINGTWMVSTVRDDNSSFINRKDLPAEWAGLRDNDFAAVSGVPDAVFCHKGLFLMAAKSREGAIALAKKSLLM